MLTEAVILFSGKKYKQKFEKKSLVKRKPFAVEPPHMYLHILKGDLTVR